ncbi:MAG: aldo/keto reductase [Parachlamydiaceae bacterium]|nr:aldo/keto reductase [Parachlamydiaceae bacterium]
MLMKYITNSSGVTMPCMLYGTAWKKDKTADLVTTAVKFGLRGIDTACQPKHYHEAGVGEAIQRLASQGINREDLYIQTKFTPLNGQDPFNIPYDKRAPLSEQVAQSFEVSKQNLGLSYVDGLILHSPLENINQTLIAWQAMENIYKQEGTKQIGISNCYDLETLKELYQAATIKPTLLQNRFYKDSNYDNEIRKWCQEQKIIYQSFWTLTANPQILSSEAVQKATQTYQKTAAQILFHVLVNIGIVPLSGTCSEKHMKEDLEIFNFDLPIEVRRDIASLFTSNLQF